MYAIMSSCNVQGMAGNLSDNTNRLPLWELGFGQAHPLYTFIRTLAWYRWWQELGYEPFTGGAGVGQAATGGQWLPGRAWGSHSPHLPMSLTHPAYPTPLLLAPSRALCGPQLVRLQPWKQAGGCADVRQLERGKPPPRRLPSGWPSCVCELAAVRRAAKRGETEQRVCVVWVLFEQPAASIARSLTHATRVCPCVPPLCVPQYCLDVAADGTAAVAPSPGDEPLVLVPKEWQKNARFFLPVDERPVDWQEGLIVTFATIGGALLVWAALLCGQHCRRTGRFTSLADAAAAGRYLAACGCLSLWRRHNGCGSASAGSSGTPPVGTGRWDPSNLSDDASSGDYSDTPGEAMQRALSMVSSLALGELPVTRSGQGAYVGLGGTVLLHLPTCLALAGAAPHAPPGLPAPADTAESGLSELAPLPRQPPEATISRRLQSLACHRLSPCNTTHALVDCLKVRRLRGAAISHVGCSCVGYRHMGCTVPRSAACIPTSCMPYTPPPTYTPPPPTIPPQANPHMVMHVALEYAVPHLGLTSELKYGGLGQVRVCCRHACWLLGLLVGLLAWAVPSSRRRDCTLFASSALPSPACHSACPPSLTTQSPPPAYTQVVELFIKNTKRSMLVCAPMYAPYYSNNGELAGGLAGATPMLSLPVVVGSTKNLVDVHVTAAPAEPGTPPVFFLLLASPIFSGRTRGTIYQHARWGWVLLVAVWGSQSPPSPNFCPLPAALLRPLCVPALPRPLQCALMPPTPCCPCIPPAHSLRPSPCLQRGRGAGFLLHLQPGGGHTGGDAGSAGAAAA